MQVRKNPVVLRKTILIATLADALIYFQADDAQTQAEDLQRQTTSSGEYFVNTLTGEMVEIGVEYRI